MRNIRSPAVQFGRFFRIHVTNSRRRGAYPEQHYDIVACEFAETGHIVLDTDLLARKAFENRSDLSDFLQSWGKYEIDEP